MTGAIENDANLDQARAGDPDAYCRLVEPCQAALLRMATALCGDPSTAEDLVQQTLIEAWKSLSRYNGSCRFSTWLSAILIHRHYKYLHALKSRPQTVASLPAFEMALGQNALINAADPTPAPDRIMLNQQQESRIRECLTQLSESHRQVVLLRFFEEATLEEIAATLGCSVGTVKSRLHYALDKLRKMNLLKFLEDE